MTTISRYVDADESVLAFLSEPEHGEVQVLADGPYGVAIRFEDVPRVALELLKAAGYGDEANPLAATDAIADLNGIIAELEVIANLKAA